MEDIRTQAIDGSTSTRITISKHGPCSISEVIPLVLSRYGWACDPIEKEACCVECEAVSDQPNPGVFSATGKSDDVIANQVLPVD